jgi:hypothetical protein
MLAGVVRSSQQSLQAIFVVCGDQIPACHTGFAIWHIMQGETLSGGYNRAWEGGLCAHCGSMMLKRNPLIHRSRSCCVIGWTRPMGELRLVCMRHTPVHNRQDSLAIYVIQVVGYGPNLTPISKACSTTLDQSQMLD